jgi:ADP-ribose pyrophosphatase YjhB (NUDIX family)
MNKKIDVLVRAIIQERGKILVCKKINRDYYFFPGGHIEFGESAKEGLERELKEELGLKILKSSFIGGSEHLFVEEGKKYHEINLVFDVLTGKINTKSKEDHLQFFLLDKKELVQKNVLPAVLKKAILKWLKDKKMFWVSQI